MPWWLLILNIIGLLIDRVMPDTYRLLAIEALLLYQLLYINDDKIDKMGCMAMLLDIFLRIAILSYITWYCIQWMKAMWNL